MQIKTLLFSTLALSLIFGACSNPAGTPAGDTELSEVKAIGAKIPKTISFDPTETPESSSSPALYIEGIQEDDTGNYKDFSIEEMNLEMLQYIALPTEILKWSKKEVSLWLTLLTDKVLAVNEELISSAELELLGLPPGSNFILEKAKFTFNDFKLNLLATLKLNAGSTDEQPDGWVLDFQMKLTFDIWGNYTLYADINQTPGFLNSYWYWIFEHDAATDKTYLLDMSSSDEYGSNFGLSMRVRNSYNRYNLTVMGYGDPDYEGIGTDILILMNQPEGVYLSEYLLENPLQNDSTGYTIKDVALYGNDYSFIGKTDTENSIDTFSDDVNTYSVASADSDTPEYYKAQWPADYPDYRDSLYSEFSSILATYFDRAVAGNLLDQNEFSDF